MPEIDKTKRREISVGLIKEVGEEGNGTFAGYASTATLDRDGEIILPEAFRSSLPEYLKNPVVMAGHQKTGPHGELLVVGKVTETKIDSYGFFVRGEFAPTKLGQEYRLLMKRGFAAGLSVGFLPKFWQDTKNEDGSWGPRVHTDVELLEISAVAIPSNRDSLMTIVDNGSLSGREFAAEMSRRGESLDLEIVKGLIKSLPNPEPGPAAGRPQPPDGGDDRDQISLRTVVARVDDVLSLVRSIEAATRGAVTRDELRDEIDLLLSEKSDPEGTYAKSLLEPGGDEDSAPDRSEPGIGELITELNHAVRGPKPIPTGRD